MAYHVKFLKKMKLNSILSKQNLRLSLLPIVFFVYLLPRTIDLGNDILNFDAQYWYPRIEKFTDRIADQKFDNLYITYHPGTTLLWTSGFANYFYRQYFENKYGFDPRGVPHHFIDIQFYTTFPLVFMISLLGVYVYWVLSKLKGNWFAIIFSILLSIEPFFLGITKFLHITGLQTMFGFAGLIAITYFLHNFKNRHLIFGGFLIGLAISTKITALLFLIIATILLLHVKQNKPFISIFTSLRNILLVMSATIITIFAVNPFMWFDPIQNLIRIYNEGVVDTGFTNTGAPQIVKITYLFYLEYGLYRLSGYTVILALIGLIFTIKNIKTISKDKLLLTTLFYFVIYNLLLTIPSKLKDRYLVELIPAFLLLATYGLIYLKQKLQRYKFLFILVVIIFWVALNIYRYHPNYSFYISDFVGGPRFMYDKQLSLMNRGEYFSNAAIYLNTLNKPESKVVFFGNDTHVVTFKDFFRGKTYFDAGAMPDKTKIHYIVVRSSTPKNKIIYELCNKLKEFGPKDPFGYSEVEVFECKNLYKDGLYQIKIES